MWSGAWNKQKLTSEIFCPTDSCLAQLVRHWPKDPEVLISIPTGGNFWRFFFSSLCKDLSDNLTETPIVKKWHPFYDRSWKSVGICTSNLTTSLQPSWKQCLEHKIWDVFQNFNCKVDAGFLSQNTACDWCRTFALRKCCHMQISLIFWNEHHLCTVLHYAD